MAELVLHLNEWECITPRPGSITSGVLLSQDNATSELLDVLRRDGALEVQELRTGLAVRASSFVGRVRIGDVIVVIEPKIQKLPLMKLLRYAYGLRDLRLLNDAGAALENNSFQDLLIWQLLTEARELIARGLHRQYVPQSARLAIPRGRLEFQNIARQPAATADLPCRFHPRLEDCWGSGLAPGWLLTGSFARTCAGQPDSSMSRCPIPAWTWTRLRASGRKSRG